MSSQDSSIARSQLEGSTLHDNFKLTKQLVDNLRPSLEKLSPHSAKVREMGANFDGVENVGMKKINTAESTIIKNGPEVGKGGLVNEVF